MKKIMIFTLLFGVVVSQLFAQGKLWSLRECVEYALEHNVTLKQQQNMIRIRQEDNKRAKFSYLPDLNAGVSHKFNFGRSLNRDNQYEDSNLQSTSFSLLSELPLFTGMDIHYSIQKTKWEVQASQAGMEVNRNQITLQIVGLYFQILLNQEIYNIAQQQITLTKEQQERTRLLIETGIAPESQLFNVIAQLADDELAATEAYHAVRLAKMELKQLMNYTGIGDIEKGYTRSK